MADADADADVMTLGICKAIEGHPQQRSEWLDARGGEKEEAERNVQREQRTVRHDRQENGKGNAGKCTEKQRRMEW